MNGKEEEVKNNRDSGIGYDVWGKISENRENGDKKVKVSTRRTVCFFFL